MKRSFAIAGLIEVALTAIIIGTLASCSPESFNGQTDETGQSVPPTSNPIPPLSCTIGNNGNPQDTQTYPTSCLETPQGLPQNASGFEMNNLTNAHVTINSNNALTGTQNGVYLYFEIATYVQPDTIIITATSTSGAQTPLLYICNYGTDTVSDPTKPHGQARPYSDTILQFSVWLPAGTASITFSVDENTPYNSGSPTYIGAWNLNEFSTSIGQVLTTGLGTDSSYNFRPQSAPLSQYNDQLDKNNPNYPNYCQGSP